MTLMTSPMRSGPLRALVTAPDRPPCASIALDQAIGGIRTGTAGGGGVQVAAGRARPGIEQTLHRTPRRLDRVGPLKRRGVADEAIVDQRLVPDRRQRREIVAVGKVHCDAVDLDLGARSLGAEADRQP